MMRRGHRLAISRRGGLKVVEPDKTSNGNSFKMARREIQEMSLDEKCCDEKIR